MKKIFLAIALLATVASCTKDDVTSQNREEIGFGGPFIQNSLKAAIDPSYGAQDFTSFNVWGTVGGVSIYSGDVVTGTVGENNIWSCSSVKQYWIKDAQYKFAALANAGTVTQGDDKLPAKVAFDASDANVDLLYAEPVTRTGASSTNAPVALTFQHLLSKVKFTVVNNSQAATGYSFDVKNIVVTCPKTGTIKLSDKTGESLGTPDKYDALSTITVDNSTASLECESELLLIPGSVSVSYTVDIKCKGTTIASHTPATAYTTTIAGGNSYNFVINVAVGEEITFKVSQNPTWTPATGGTDVTIQ